MRQERSKECFHKIVAYQNHTNCTLMAAICQNHCQTIHASNPGLTVNANEIYSQYKKIKKCFVQAIKNYTDKMSKSYEEMMKQYNKNYTERLRGMEKQLLNYLMANININKDVLEKIENQRLEKLRCNQVNAFLRDTSNIQQKVKSAPLEPIYFKHINLLKKDHSQFSEQIVHSKIINQNYLAELQKYKTEIEALQKSKDSLQVEIGRLREQKRKNLKVKTWNILRIATKKRLKGKKEAFKEALREEANGHINDDGIQKGLLIEGRNY